MKKAPLRRESDAARYARVIAFVKHALDRTITTEDVQRVQRGEYTESHPVDAAIHAGLHR